MAQTKREEYLKWLNKPGNREKKNAQKRAWYEANKERVKEYKANLSPESRAADYATHIEWKKRNPDRLKVYNKRLAEKTSNDPAALARKEIRRVIYDALRRKKLTSDPLEKLVGCTKQQLKDQLELSFKEGMTWDNYGSFWQVDHIKPLILFDVLEPEDFKRSTHFSNLQPLLSVENMKKGAKYSQTKEAA